MDNLEKVLKIAASAIAIVIPCVLLAGYSYHLGYIMTFGLSGDLIPKSMSDVLVESWYVSVIALAWALSYWEVLLGIFIASFLLGVASLLFFRLLKSKGINWVFDEITQQKQGKSILGFTQWHWICLGQLFRDLSSIIILPMAILVVLAAFLVLPYTEGEDEALIQIERFNDNGCDCKTEDKPLSCIRLIDTTAKKNVIAYGVLVSANDNRIAVFTGKLEVWPMLDNYIIDKEFHQSEPTDDGQKEKAKSE